MPCYHPLHGFLRYDGVSGKSYMKVFPSDVTGVELDGSPVRGDPYSYKDDPSIETGFLEIPCGKCIGCRQDQSKEWANRLMMEMNYHDSAYFVTLTYDNDHVPIVFDDETGEANGFMTLNKRDVQLFMKLLRRNFPDDKIRYYLAGEYGDQTLRPHYHAIIFGLHLPNLIPSGRSETGNQYYVSPDLQRIWKKGFVSCEPANYATCKYVSSYVTKKIGNKPNEVYENQGMVPPFSLSSRRPGIGYKYFEDHPEVIRYAKITLGTAEDSYTFNLPRYFRKKIRDLDPDRADEISRINAKKFEDKKEFILARTNKSWSDYLKEREEVHLERVKTRSKI